MENKGLYGIGKIEGTKTRNGKLIFKGYIGKLPVVGFKGTKEENKDVIYLAIDVRKVEFLLSRRDSREFSEAASGSEE